ncbi:MAG: hypothetical protein U0350_39950 [Caldilineaceae bacterium]
MSTIAVRQADGSIVYLNVTGTGTAGNPFLLKGANSDAVLAALQALEATINDSNQMKVEVITTPDAPALKALLEAIGETPDKPVGDEATEGSVLATLRGLWSDIKTLAAQNLRLLQAIARPWWYDEPNNALRVNVALGTLTTVTTVSTLSNQTQIGGVDAKTSFVDQLMRASWAENIRARMG